MTTSLSRRAALAGAATLALAPAVRAPTALAETSLAAPTGPVLLEASGSIRLTNGAGNARLDRAMLAALPQTGFETSSPWTEKATRFDGIAGSTLVEALGAFGREVVAVALNDYRVTIPFADFGPGGLLIASQVDGKAIPVRARGPLWIVYPFDQRPNFRSELFYSRSIWQLRRLEFRS